MKSGAWRDIEEEDLTAWTAIRDGVFLAAEPIAHPGICPSCGKAEVRYFYRRSDQPGPLRDRGASWFWCPSCLRYGHYSALVPRWWSNPASVDYDQLTHSPEWLQEHWHEILAAGHPMALAKRDT